MDNNELLKYFFFVPGITFFCLEIFSSLIGYDVSFWVLLICSFLLGLILWSKKKIDVWEKTSAKDSEEKTGKIRENVGVYIKKWALIIVFIVFLYFLASYLMSIDLSGQSKDPFGEVFLLENQNGAGGIENTGHYGMRLGVGAAGKGTTFKLQTKANETGWPSFGADFVASRQGSVLKVTYLDTKNPKMSVYFKEIYIPTSKIRYSNKYKLDNYRASIKNATRSVEVDNGNKPFRAEPSDFTIELEVYVMPDSYVEMNNITIYRDK